MHLQSEQAGGTYVGAQGLVGQPVSVPPDDFRLHVVGERVHEHGFSDRNLALILRAGEHLESGLPGQGDDRLAERGMIVLLHRLAALVFALIRVGHLLVADDPVGRIAQAGMTQKNLPASSP